MYIAIKTVHVVTVCVSLSLFLVRSYSLFTGKSWHARRLMRVIPHVNDTLLLLSAVGLTLLIGQYPFVESWLTVKLLLLVAYIILGLGVMRFATSREQRIVLFVLALLCFATIVAVALGHDTVLSRFFY